MFALKSLCGFSSQKALSVISYYFRRWLCALFSASKYSLIPPLNATKIKDAVYIVALNVRMMIVVCVNTLYVV